MTSVERILWPPHYEPENSAVHVCNELLMDAPAETVWAWLIRAPLWPSWYANSSDVRFIDGMSPDLALGTRFQWITFGIRIESTVLEFVPYERIAWDGHGLGTDVYHAWLISKSPAAGCLVLTEETQHGWMPRVSNLLMPRRMWRHHQIWLETLNQHARQGCPPDQ
jgi:uncharacterized protein YndB with AHSA1/START domain